MSRLEKKTDWLSKELFVNVGPSHPASHGVFHFKLHLDGETIRRCDTEIGYLHRAFEKEAEAATWTQVIPYTDRLNYCSAMCNNVGFAQAVERLMGLEIPRRAQFIRVIVAEMSRIMDHFICVGINAVDVGAFTNFLYFFTERERLYDLIEELCGARLTTNYTRIGGVAHDLPGGWLGKLSAALARLPAALADVDRLLTRNRIFVDRTRGVGTLSREEAIAYAWTGPNLRACGVGLDARKAHPYLVYDELAFDVPTDDGCDVYARYLVRMEEMRQSIRILGQCVEKIEAGPVRVDDPRVSMPDKDRVYNQMEGLIRQFKLVIDGIQVPAGEIYDFTEAANGELGFHLVSDGSGHPYRVRCRPPCFPIFSAFDRMMEGAMMADLVAALGSINIIAGELER